MGYEILSQALFIVNRRGMTNDHIERNQFIKSLPAIGLNPAETFMPVTRQVSYISVQYILFSVIVVKSLLLYLNLLKNTVSKLFLENQ